MTSPKPADLVIYGRAATFAGKSGWGWAAGIAVAGGRVIGVGGRRDLSVFVGPRTRLWPLPSDIFVMPAITDAHLHLVTLLISRTQLDLSGLSGADATLAALAQAHARRLAAGDRAGWLLGHGWSLDALGMWPDLAMLEHACPGRPVALWSHDHHTRWVSRRALALAGIDADTPEPMGGSLRRDAAGNLTGILHETAAGLVDPAIPEPSDEVLEAELGVAANDLFALGISGCHDPGELTSAARIRRGPLFYRRLAERGRLPLRVHSSIRAAELDHAIELALRSGEGIGRYRMGWLKLFADGSMGSRSAALLEPYSDADRRPPTGGPRGMFLESPEQIGDHLERAAIAGISGQVHAIGDAAVRAALDVFTRVPRGPLPARIEHAQLVDPADVRRFGKLGVAASVQPVHLRTDAWPQREAWGERTHNSFPLAALARGGALIPFGTDAPVEPVDPWPGIAAAVARRDPFAPTDPPTGPKQALELARAVRAACLDPALVARQPDLGRLVTGNRADFIVVPAAGFAKPLDAARLASTRPLATIVDGEVVYRAPDFDP